MNPVGRLELALSMLSGTAAHGLGAQGAKGHIEDALTALRGPEPDWSEAPEDATHYAVDSDGTGRWWRVEPEPNGYTWGADGFNKWFPSGHFGLSLGTDWRLTLRRRPNSDPS